MTVPFCLLASIKLSIYKEVNMGNKLKEVLFIEADPTIADSVMGRGTRNRALLKAIKERLNELEII